MPLIDGRSEIQEIQISGDHAYMWSQLRVEVTPPGGVTVKRAGHTLSVLRKRAAAGGSRVTPTFSHP